MDVCTYGEGARREPQCSFPPARGRACNSQFLSSPNAHVASAGPAAPGLLRCKPGSRCHQESTKSDGLPPVPRYQR